jgi:hypothetical protein
VPRLSLVRTTSFRLAAIYLLLFTLSALALGAFVYLSVRREILADFDERIVEETDSLRPCQTKSGPIAPGVRLARQNGIPSEHQSISARHSPSAAERLCL